MKLILCWSGFKRRRCMDKFINKFSTENVGSFIINFNLFIIIVSGRHELEEM